MIEKNQMRLFRILKIYGGGTISQNFLMILTNHLTCFLGDKSECKAYRKYECITIQSSELLGQFFFNRLAWYEQKPNLLFWRI